MVLRPAPGRSSTLARPDVLPLEAPIPAGDRAGRAAPRAARRRAVVRRAPRTSARLPARRLRQGPPERRRGGSAPADRARLLPQGAVLDAQQRLDLGRRGESRRPLLPLPLAE